MGNREKNGRFTPGGPGGPGRPKKKPQPMRPEDDDLADDLAERADRMLEEFQSQSTRPKGGAYARDPVVKRTAADLLRRSTALSRELDVFLRRYLGDD